MNGQISVCVFGAPAVHYVLKEAALRIGSAPDCDLSLGGAHLLPEHARLTWEQRTATWVLTPFSPVAARTIRVNGITVASKAALQHGDIIELPDVFIRLQRVPDTPRHATKDLNEVKLHRLKRLMIGRADGQETDPEKLALDAADLSISREHVLLEKDATGDWVAVDKSQAGTPLNDQFFRERKLQVGDLLKIGSYSFEFTGYSLRRVPRQSGARIEARGISVTLKSGRRILNDVSLDIERCTFVGIVGGSGQGKSTLLNALCGINPATEGKVYINDMPLDDPRQMASAGIGFVPQDDIVHCEITVEQALHFSARLRLPPETPARAISSLVDETIARLDLTDHRFKTIAQLSGGQRKRVSIATELLSKPSVLFLDEPSSGLDPATEFSLMSLLNSLAKTCTIVCTTHVLENAQLFDKLLFVQDGHVVCDVDTERPETRGPEAAFVTDSASLTGTRSSTAYRLRPAAEMAMAHFQATNLLKIYQMLAMPLQEGGKSGKEWREQFEKQRGTFSRPDFGSQNTEVPMDDSKKRRGGGYMRSLLVQLTRQWAILRSDKLNLVFIAAQPMLIALLIGWVAKDAVLRSFLCVVATLWFGCSNGAQQIVRELPVFRRERVCGLGMNCYVHSKLLFLGALTTVQALLLLLITLATAYVFHPPEFDREVFREKMAAVIFPAPPPTKESRPDEVFSAVAEGEKPAEPAALEPGAGSVEATVASEEAKRSAWQVSLLTATASFFGIADNLMDGTEPVTPESRDNGLTAPMGIVRILFGALVLRFAALFAAAIVGIAIGLTISALVRNSTQAVLWVPLVLIPQILFGGFVVTRPEMTASVRSASVFIPSFCAQRLMDVAHVFGQAVPRMSNRTRYPVFLTPGGDQETIEWETVEGHVSEDYDKVSAHNKSWQNLIVFPALAGQHSNRYSIIRGVKKYDESVEARDDVRYPMGIIYHNLSPAASSVGVLLLWITLCYIATWFGLRGKQKGK